MAAIGFIGVGNMGGPMVRNLLKARHRVTVFDVVPAAIERCVEAGADAARSIQQAAHDNDIVITMLPAGTQVREVYLGRQGILGAARPGTLLIDSSTIDVATARDVGTAAHNANLPMIDAPVSGGVGGAQAGTLTFMVGGPDAAFVSAKPILATMGKTIVHAGNSGSGQAAKICNNMILGISMIGVCEAFVLAERLGLDRQKLFDIASTSSGQCWSLTSYCPVPGPVPTSPANRDYAAGFTADMMLKDLRLSQDAAAQTQATTALGALAARLYEAFASAGMGAKDFSGIIELIRSSPG
jgi:3-hydroxyisobutyrate dehydrogenase